MWYTKSILKEIDMDKIIYNVDDFTERLSELAIGTEDAQALTEFVERLDARYQWQARRAQVAAKMLGHSMIEDALMDEDDV